MQIKHYMNEIRIKPDKKKTKINIYNGNLIVNGIEFSFPTTKVERLRDVLPKWSLL